MPRNQRQRRTDDLRAVDVLAKHVDPIMAIVAQSIADVDPGQSELTGCIRDTRLVLDIARRLDDLIPVPEPVESWDVLLWTLVAGLALGIYRAAQRKPDPEAKARALAARALSTARKRIQTSG